LDSITYRIASFKDNEYYLIGINDIAFECGTIDNIEKNTKNNTINEKQTLEKLNLSLNSKDIQNSSLSPMATSSVNACNMRVLVMYTPAAKALVSDIQNTIEHEMDLSNQYMENSGVNETWELAFTGLTIYTEALDDRNQDLGRFRATYEGYMDEVHNLRAKYSADVCVLISKCTGNCGGVAAHIYATPAYAFCLVHIDVLGTDPWVFAHEIGHVIACRHEVSKDSLMTPYAYVHGYVNADTSFTTIMATIPPHIPYWSNPNIYYDGEPIGTASYNNCALALTQKIPEKVKFLQPVSDITITSTEVNNMSFGDVISEQTATLSGITVQNGSTLKVRSNYVTINNGFTAQLGAELEIINEAVLDCP
jgi:hypothetical protein